MQSNSTTMTDLPDLCREAPAVAVPGGPVSDQKRSSTTYVGDRSTTPSSKSLSSSVDEKSSSEGHIDEHCGWGAIQPRCCQVFRNAKVVLFFLCCLATIQVASPVDLLCSIYSTYFQTCMSVTLSICSDVTVEFGSLFVAGCSCAHQISSCHAHLEVEKLHSIFIINFVTDLLNVWWTAPWSSLAAGS